MATPTGSTVIPTLRYRDAHLAIDWLCSAFGFRRHAVYADEDVVHHAQLEHGTGMIRLGSAEVASDWGRFSAQPDEIGGRGYACRDIEGHLWWFGTYDPWSPPAGDGAGTA